MSATAVAWGVLHAHRTQAVPPDALRVLARIAYRTYVRDQALLRLEEMDSA